MRSLRNTRSGLGYIGLVLTVLHHQRLPQVLTIQGEVRQSEDQSGDPKPTRAREGQKHTDGT